MLKMEFIERIFEMYPKSFTQNNTTMWIEAYSQSLPDNIDYDELFQDMLDNYTHISSAPPVSFFKPYVNKQRARQRKEEEYNKFSRQREQWRKEIEELEKNDRPVTEPILTPQEIIDKHGIKVVSGKRFTDEEMQIFRDYVKIIPQHRLQCEFWMQLGHLIVEKKMKKS